MADTSAWTLRLLSLLQARWYWPGDELVGRSRISPRTLRWREGWTPTGMVPLGVTNDDSVAGAAKAIEGGGGLDVLVNNAGIEGRKADGGFGAAELTADMMRTIFETNLFGVVRVTHAFLPLLRSAAPVIVNVSSGLGSMARMTTAGTPASAYPGVAYPASKAAVNMLTVQYAKAFPGIRINAVEPGFTATDLNAFQGTQTVEQGAERMAHGAGRGRRAYRKVLRRQGPHPLVGASRVRPRSVHSLARARPVLY